MKITGVLKTRLTIARNMAENDEPSTALAQVLTAIIEGAEEFECFRCDGTGEEPGVPDDEVLGTPLCIQCDGKHRVDWKQLRKHY